MPMLSFFEMLFCLLMLGIMGLFFLSLVFSWSWAQQKAGSSISLTDILAAAAVEWGAFLSLLVTHFLPLKSFYEAPPLGLEEASPQQLPVIFVPPLHTRSTIYLLLVWRLKKNFWNSLWIFNWKSFLQEPELLEDQLCAFIDKVIHRTEARRFRIISFGSSRPIVAKALDRKGLRAYCDKWLAISAPAYLSSFYQFISTKRMKSAYAHHTSHHTSETPKNPDLVICGENDFFCYPLEVFGESKKIVLPNVGHYSSLLHSSTTQAVMKELSSE